MAPLPNQIVRITYGAGFSAASAFVPVSIEGILKTTYSESRLNWIDGSADIHSGYELQAESVERFGNGFLGMDVVYVKDWVMDRKVELHNIQVPI